MFAPELIELLKQMPIDEPIMLEGCDCWGKALGVKREINPTLDDDNNLIDEKVILITRID